MVMFTSVGDMSLELQKAILRECPINSKCHKTWLAYLDKVEAKVRNSNLTDNANRIMLKLYEDACSFLSESWDNEAYVVMFIRRTVLALHEQSSEGLFLLTMCSVNAKRNSKAAIAVSFLFDAVGQRKRAENLITMAKKFADHNGLKQLTAAEHLLAHEGDLKPLLGVFYYEPPFRSDIKPLDGSLSQNSDARNMFKKPIEPRSQRTSLFSSALQAHTVQGSVSSSFVKPLSTSAFSASRTDFITRSRHSEFSETTPELRRYTNIPEAEHTPQPTVISKSSWSPLKTSQLIATMSTAENYPTFDEDADISSTIFVSSDFSQPMNSMLLPVTVVTPQPPQVSEPIQLPSHEFSQSPIDMGQSANSRVPLQTLNMSHMRAPISVEPNDTCSTQSQVTDENCPVPFIRNQRFSADSPSNSAQDSTLPSSLAVSQKSIVPESLMMTPISIERNHPKTTQSQVTDENCPVPFVRNQRNSADSLSANAQDSTMHSMLAVEHKSPVDAPECIVVNGQSYWVVNELGRGGSSVVYFALDSKRRSWAVKCVNLNSVEKQLTANFANEISMLRSLGDTGRVIRLHDCELRPDRLILVLEHASTDLKNVFIDLMRLASTEGGGSEEPRLPLFAVLFYWDQMLRCVKVLHDRRIVHLDLKPQNFVLVNGILKLIDLGISQRLPDDSTRINNAVPLGTLTFMSPEQLEGPAPSSSQSGRLWSPEAVPDSHLTVGRKSDIWSLGVMLYMMVYGRLPFPQTTVQSRMLAIINPALPIDFPAIQNQAIHKALQRCLVRDYKERASIDELLSYAYV